MCDFQFRVPGERCSRGAQNNAELLSLLYELNWLSGRRLLPIPTYSFHEIGPSFFFLFFSIEVGILKRARRPEGLNRRLS